MNYTSKRDADLVNVQLTRLTHRIIRDEVKATRSDVKLMGHAMAVAFQRLSGEEQLALVHHARLDLMQAERDLIPAVESKES